MVVLTRRALLGCGELLRADWRRGKAWDPSLDEPGDHGQYRSQTGRNLMYTDSDLDAAVAERAITAEAVASFRDFMAQRQNSPSVDEEHFRLLTGFNDIFVSIAAVLLLIAVSWLAGAISPVVGGVADVVVSWGLAEYFTRRRRMALPSILLLVSFSVGVFGTG